MTLKNISSERIKKYSSVNLLLILSALECFTALFFLLQLPLSMEKNAILAGFSLFRLLITILLFSFAFLFSATVFYSFFNVAGMQKFLARLRKFFISHDTFLAALVFLLPLFCLVFIGFVFILNPQLFPGMIIYYYLYIRFLPLDILLIFLSAQLFLWLFFTQWVPNSVNFNRISQDKNRYFWQILAVVIALILQVILWSKYSKNPLDFINHQENNFIFLLVITTLLGISLVVEIHYDEKRK